MRRTRALPGKSRVTGPPNVRSGTRAPCSKEEEHEPPPAKPGTRALQWRGTYLRRGRGCRRRGRGCRRRRRRRQWRQRGDACGTLRRRFLVSWLQRSVGATLGPARSSSRSVTREDEPVRQRLEVATDGQTKSGSCHRRADKEWKLPQKGLWMWELEEVSGGWWQMQAGTDAGRKVR
jgi:hypothetical protein